MGKFAAICAVFSLLFIQLAHASVVEDDHTHLSFQAIDVSHTHHKSNSSESHHKLSQDQHKSSHDYHNLVHDNNNIVFFDGSLTPIVMSYEVDRSLPIFDLRLGLSLSPPVPPPLS